MRSSAALRSVMSSAAQITYSTSPPLFSFGLPNRNGFNGAFISMAIQAGMTSAITNPLHAEVVAASLGADVMLGKDPDCGRWIKHFREPAAEGAIVRGTGRRAGRRRRPAA